eukprot:TRINITY_DN31639_c0_g1_i1.p1 TRINITY_DN31639_c0_g1~~TRINITY_DN31639_c0_g1_i1.p1  ORF type:complete len:561 (+),score=82.50 TRINITY_DN31639_c0_g1_i1:55-1683(+)
MSAFRVRRQAPATLIFAVRAQWLLSLALGTKDAFLAPVGYGAVQQATAYNGQQAVGFGSIQQAAAYNGQQVVPGQMPFYSQPPAIQVPQSYQTPQMQSGTWSAALQPPALQYSQFAAGVPTFQPLASQQSPLLPSFPSFSNGAQAPTQVLPSSLLRAASQQPPQQLIGDVSNAPRSWQVLPVAPSSEQARPSQPAVLPATTQRTLTQPAQVTSDGSRAQLSSASLTSAADMIQSIARGVLPQAFDNLVAKHNDSTPRPRDDQHVAQMTASMRPAQDDAKFAQLRQFADAFIKEAGGRADLTEGAKSSVSSVIEAEVSDRVKREVQKLKSNSESVIAKLRRQAEERTKQANEMAANISHAAQIEVAAAQQDAKEARLQATRAQENMEDLKRKMDQQAKFVKEAQERMDREARLAEFRVARAEKVVRELLPTLGSGASWEGAADVAAPLLPARTSAAWASASPTSLETSAAAPASNAWVTATADPVFLDSSAAIPQSREAVSGVHVNGDNVSGGGRPAQALLAVGATPARAGMRKLSLQRRAVA